MRAVILSGGEATRLRPLTCNISKVMVPVLNRPFLQHLVSYLKSHNIVDITLAIGRTSGQVESYFGDGSRFGASIRYSTESVPLGTAGAVKNTERLLNSPFMVFNGDVYTDIDLTAMINAHERSGAIATLALTPVDDPTAYGVVETAGEGRITRFVEKPSREEAPSNLVNAGVYVLHPDILNYITPNTSVMFERDVFPSVLAAGATMYAYPSHAYWIDIGTPERYLSLNHELLRRDFGPRGLQFEGEHDIHPSAQIEGPVLIGKGCSVEGDCTIEGPTVLGQGCKIREGAIIRSSLLWQGCEIDRGARLRNSILASRCYVGEGSLLNSSVLGDNVMIGGGTPLPQNSKIWPDGSIPPSPLPH
jgi:mannose-1-phosphate guanylyltransferase